MGASLSQVSWNLLFLLYNAADSPTHSFFVFFHPLFTICLEADGTDWLTDCWGDAHVPIILRDLNFTLRWTCHNLTLHKSETFDHLCVCVCVVRHLVFYTLVYRFGAFWSWKSTTLSWCSGYSINKVSPSWLGLFLQKEKKSVYYCRLRGLCKTKVFGCMGQKFTWRE